MTLSAKDVVLIEDGVAKSAIVAASGDLQPDAKDADGVRLKRSIEDLAHYLGKMSGATVEVVADALPAGDQRLPILIGGLGEQRFGEPKQQAVFKQGLRVVVASDAVALYGESPLASSYAIYELLDRLGCRWFMPSELGESIPASKTVTVTEGDDSLAPYTYYRGIWFADDDYKRRNRLGGQILHASHALEGYVSKEAREAHPEWNAINDGRTHHRRLKWSGEGVPEAIAEGIIAILDKNPAIHSISLSPDDGLGYDDTDDRQLDAGDYDASIGDVSITDRQVWLCNKVIELVNQKHPGIMYGMLAYGASTRPPVREMPHPQLIPQIAPITYRRAHPMTWDEVPDNEDLRYAITGWAKVSPSISYYFYGWFLAEPSAPNPFLAKWSEDCAFIYANGNSKFWQPETIANFETTLHALYLGIRLAWNPEQNAQAIFAEINERFYGEAAAEMQAYWEYIDSCWTSVPEYAGAAFGHLRRWTPERLQKADELMKAALAAATDPVVRQRIELNALSLSMFEDFMALRRDLAEGRFEGLDVRAAAYKDRMNAAAIKYEPQYCFSKAGYLRGEDNNWNTRYFNAFYLKSYNDAARIATEHQVITPPLRDWRFQADPETQGEVAGWHQPEHDDAAWKRTDVAVDTWSSIGFHGYLGRMWYRQQITVPQLPEGKKVYLWIGATDGSATLFVNGQHVPWHNEKGEEALFTGYCQPVSFDITSVVKAGENQVSILCNRTFINELGTGGILGAPVVIYTER